MTTESTTKSIITLTKEMYTLKEAAELLAVSYYTVKKWQAEKLLPVVYLGQKGRRRCVRVTRGAIENLIAQGVE